MEILFLKRLTPLIFYNGLLPDHQFSFRHKHCTIEQAHRLIERINSTFEPKQYCFAVFLDITQAFDRVWHEGLLHKIKIVLPDNCAFIISYLSNRHFQVKQGDVITSSQNKSWSSPRQRAWTHFISNIYF